MLTLKATGIGKSYPVGSRPGQAVLRGIDLDYSSDKIVCVVGANGSGKSTLLRILAGLETADTGEVVVERSGGGPSPVVGLLLQELGLFDWKTVRQHLDFGFECAGVEKRLWREVGDRILESLSLARHAEKFPDELSGGLRQRCAIARLLAYGAEILLLDEPFAAVDSSGRTQLGKLIEELWKDGRHGLIVVEHDLENAVLLADTVVVLTESPGHIAGVVDVDLPRPRGISVRSSDAFMRAVAQIENLLELGKK